MKDKTNLKVEFRSVRTSNFMCRRIYYRVVPKELPLLKRLFRNRWKPLFHPCKNPVYTSASYLYRFENYIEEIKPLKTLGDVYNYLNKNTDTLKKRKEDEDKLWP